EQRVREGVPDPTDTQVIDRRLVAELVHCFHHPTALLGVDGEPGEGGGHGVHGARPGRSGVAIADCFPPPLRCLTRLEGEVSRLPPVMTAGRQGRSYAPIGAIWTDVRSAGA